MDTDSISSDQVVENDVQKTLWTARVAVIRADLNRRYIYLMQFDPDKRMYQIFASEVQRYDTRTCCSRATRRNRRGHTS